MSRCVPGHFSGPDGVPVRFSGLPASYGNRYWETDLRGIALLLAFIGLRYPLGGETCLHVLTSPTIFQVLQVMSSGTRRELKQNLIRLHITDINTGHKVRHNSDTTTWDLLKTSAGEDRHTCGHRRVHNGDRAAVEARRVERLLQGFEEEKEDRRGSDASSDLFELETLIAIGGVGGGGFGDELSVYETTTTRRSTNDAIARHGLIL
uniref:Uncharacterized protein n=1 Tax=Ananas comosus var. bracteatus TaxID=296719 RepID=A0A6V7P1Y2_ANACO|nr:unnamed protein product [Ananas comosus var. bracteatus]